MRGVRDKVLLALKGGLKLGDHVVERTRQASDLIIHWRRSDAHREFPLRNAPTGLFNLNQWSQSHAYEWEDQGNGQTECSENAKKQGQMERREKIVDGSRRCIDLEKSHGMEICDQWNEDDQLALPLSVLCEQVPGCSLHNLLYLLRRNRWRLSIC